MAMTEWELCRTGPEQEGIRILLCDDDPAFLAQLGRELHRILQKRNIKARISSFQDPGKIGKEQLAACQMAFFDVDLESEGCNGIDLARQLRQVNSRALLFFVTNFIDYAPAGYEVQAFRYILKGDMAEVLERYMMYAAEQLAEGQEQLWLRGRDEVHRIPLGEISYLEVMDHSVSIHAGKEVRTLSTTLSCLEERLAPHGFLRIHKSFLVNMACIRKFRSRECLLADGTVLAVSEKNYAVQKQRYLLWKGLT